MKQTIPYVIFSGDHAAVIEVPRDMSADAYGELQEWFCTLVKSKQKYSCMRKLWAHCNIGGVWYHDELAGPDGASFEVFAFPETPKKAISAATTHILRRFDVVSLRTRHFVHIHDIQNDVDRIAASHCAHA